MLESTSIHGNYSRFKRAGMSADYLWMNLEAEGLGVQG